MPRVKGYTRRGGKVKAHTRKKPKKRTASAKKTSRTPRKKTRQQSLF